MKKIFLFTLVAALTAGFAACSDSDDENDNGGTTPETKHELTEAQMLQREAVASVLNRLTDENFSDTTDVDFEGRTYEATIGQVRNESRPSERSIKVSSATLAEGYFRSLVGGASDLIQETSDGYKIDLTNLDCHSTGKKQSLGTLTYHNGYGANDVGYADIDIACIPSLQRISYKTQDQWGDNGTYESGCSYGEVYVGFRRTYSFTCTPSYMTDNEILGHSASLSFNYTGNKDLNKFAIGESDVKTMAIGANYTLSVKPWNTDFSLTLSNQTSRGYKTKYTSRIGTLSTGHTFFEDNPLVISGSISLVYNEVERQSKSLNIGGDISASYTLKQYHVFSASASFYKYGDVNPTKLRSTLDRTDITVSLNYAYTFSLFAIKNKEERGIFKKKWMKRLSEISEGFSE